MPKDIEPKLKLISSYLKLEKNEEFVIPEYQRGYSWGKDECDKLWQDIESFIETNTNDPYFFGTIIVDCSQDGKMNLIDGQQRTTTFLLLLKALLLILNKTIPNVSDDEENEPLKAGLKANRNKIMTILFKAEDEDIPLMLRDHSRTQGVSLLINKSINELYPEEVVKIIESDTYDSAEKVVYKIARKQKDNKYTNQFRNFKYFIEKISEKNITELNKFAKTFLNSCQVIEIRSWQTEQSITMFNSLNSTGLPLSDSDIISAELYSRSGDDKTEFNNKWKSLNELSNILNYSKIVDINNILQQYMYIVRSLSKEYVKEVENGISSVDVTTPGLRRYYTILNKDLLSSPVVFCENLYIIAKKWNLVKEYASVRLLLKFNENAKIYLACYLYRYDFDDITELNIQGVCESLLKLFTILELSDIGYSSALFKTYLFRINVSLVNRDIDEKEIIKDFSNHIKINFNKDEIRDSIIEYEKNAIVFLNEYLYAKSKGLFFSFSDSVNVEHIMPASGRNRTSIQQDANISDSDEFAELVNQIGNKILLEEDINKSIGNDWFRTKKQTSINSKSGYKDSKYAIAASLTNYQKDKWEAEDIKNATNKAVERIIGFIFE